MSPSEAGTGNRKLQKGQYVFREHETGEAAFVVMDGQVEIVKTVAQKEVVLGVVGAGGMFGEMALIDNQLRMASARVLSGEVELMVITPAMLEKKLETSDPFMRALVNVLSDHVRSIAETLSTEIRAS